MAKKQQPLPTLASLGNTAKSASVPSPSIEAKSNSVADTGKMESVVKRFYLQSVSRRLLPSHRVGDCLRRVIPLARSVKIVKDRRNGKTGYRNLIRCGLLWACPVCASAITEKRSLDLQAGVKNWHTQDGFVLFATYTMKHHSAMPLADSLETLKRALRRFKSGRAYQTMIDDFGIVGSVKALEITHGANGWHPHIHELIFCRPMSKPALNRLIRNSRDRWLESLRKEGGDGERAIAYTAKTADSEIYDYIAKYGREPVGAGWTIEREMVKSPAKMARRDGVTPFQLLETAENDKTSAALFCEYVHTMHGVRQLVWTKGLREQLGLDAEKEDSELSAEDSENENYQALAEIENADWYYVINSRKFSGDVRAEMLRIAATDGIEALNAFIRSFYDAK